MRLTDSLKSLLNLAWNLIHVYNFKFSPAVKSSTNMELKMNLICINCTDKYALDRQDNSYMQNLIDVPVGKRTCIQLIVVLQCEGCSL